jgi:predicted flap endonuclease-1-like 5' DNA nuclease
MGAIAVLVLGVLIGWLVEWVIDWLYWRGQIKGISAENTNLHTENASLQESVRFLEARKDLRLLSSKNIPLMDGKGNHNLHAIKGIGPIFAKRLKESGITTFEQLSQLKPRQMEEILGTLYKRFFAKQDTILSQAKEYSKQIHQSK